MAMASRILCFLILTFSCSIVSAQDWAFWRGPEQNGISRETNLPSNWSLDDETNVVWKSEIGGRATPIIMNGRVFLNCRTSHDFNDPKEKIHSRERVVCWNLESGKLLWEDEFNVYHTDIPAPRVGWASMCGDTETGYVYVHSVCGTFRCYTPDGKVVWERELHEEFGKISGYGGRTQSPIVDEDRVIVSFLAANWGDTKGPAPKHYYYAFDKKTGELQWVSAPGSKPLATNQSALIAQVVNGERVMIGGNSDGGIHGFNARTGKPIWSFFMSRGGINASPAVDGNLVYIAHGEDNIDNTEFGRVQCIDMTAGTGDITEKGSVWRYDGLKAGFTGLLVKDGVLYVVSDTGNLYAFDSKSGKRLWEHDLGTVGKGSPVWADGKMYVMEVNGNIHILEANREGCKTLSHVNLKSRIGPGLDEIYASPAISNGKVVFVTRDRTICIGDKSKQPAPGKPVALAPESELGTKVASIQIRPYEIVLRPNAPVTYEVLGFDKKGRMIKKMEPGSLKLAMDESLTGIELEGATISTGETEKNLAGKITATVGELTATARVRKFSSAKEWNWDFEGFKGVQVPPIWLRAFAKLKPVDVDGNTALMAAGIGKAKGRPSHAVFIGTPDMSDYTIQADVLMREQRRQLPKIGLIANRYTFMLKGNVGKAEILSWSPHKRMAQQTNFPCDPDIWYTMKMTVKVEGENATVYGKAWVKGEDEPAEWTLTATDVHANKTGSPGLYVYATTDCMFDNVNVKFHK